MIKRCICLPALALLAGLDAMTGGSLAQSGAPPANPLARLTAAAGASMAGVQSPWVKGYNSTVRLIAGADPAEVPGGRRLLVGLEIRLNDGWKTYWRHPGDDGGMPPSLDWSASRNLKAARLSFPAPERLKSLGGTSIGYTKAVLLPIEVEAIDPAAPVELAVSLEYGICREICVPAEAKLNLTLPSTLAAMPAELAAARGKVPRPLNPASSGGNPLKTAKATLTGAAPALIFDIAAESGTDLFVEAPEGTYLPVPARVGEPAGGIQRFRIDLKGVEDVAKLAGKALRLTITGAGGGVELAWTVR